MYPAHYTGVLLEEIRDQVKTVAEAATTNREVLEEKIETFRAEFKQENADLRKGLSVLHDKIDGVRTELKQEIVGVRTELKEEIAGVRTELLDKIEDVRTDLGGRIDLIGVRLDGHDREIAELKRVQGLG